LGGKGIFEDEKDTVDGTPPRVPFLVDAARRDDAALPPLST